MAKSGKSEMKKTMEKWDNDLKSGRRGFKKFMVKRHK